MHSITQSWVTKSRVRKGVNQAVAFPIGGEKEALICLFFIFAIVYMVFRALLTFEKG